MFVPVAPEEFFETVAGRELRHNAELAIDTVRYRQPNGLLQTREATQEEVRANMDNYSRWLTGNFDPDTNTHTLYRGVDDDMLADALTHNSLTSRAVRYFGDYDMKLAERTLRKAAKGKIDRHLREAVEQMIPESEKKLVRRGLREDIDFPGLQATKEMLRGRPSIETSKCLIDKADLLAEIQERGQSAYIAAVQEASKDDVPPIVNGSLYGLTHSSIHLTTDLEFVKKHIGSRWFSHIIKVTFEPGSLPVAPNIGVLNEEIILPKNSHASIDEMEWYGIGQLSANHDVTITQLL